MDPAFEHSAAPVTAQPGGEDLADSAPRLSGIEESEQFEPGETIELGGASARYELLRPLGQGGTAEVFLARKVGPGDFVREVALKRMTPGLELDERARRAFVFEARLASRLRHPNIAEAYDLAQVGDRYYLVLEHIDGVTSRAAMQAAQREHRPLTEGFCCHVAASIADALHHAHNLADADGQPLGIVHRDVSAKNVMIARSGVVKLLDFGIAVARMQGRDRTCTGTLKGTFSYLSPEQILGDPLDGRSDLFSLAILLVELLTGRRVFDTGSEAGTIHRITECSLADVRAATAGLPRSLAKICEKALSRRPADRFQDAAELANALRRHLARRGIEYGPGDCAAELGELGLLVEQPVLALPDTAVAEPRSSAVLEQVSPAPAAHEAEGRAPKPRRTIWPTRAIAFALVAVTLLLPAFSGREVAEPVDARRFQPQTHPASAAPLAAAELPPPAAPEPAAPPSQATPAAVGAPLDEPVVRPKRRTDTSRAGQSGGQGAARTDRSDRPARSIALAGFADRPSVESAGATLMRGTLVPARLTRPVDASSPGQAEAVVTEDVVNDGALAVPKGSTVVCSSRRSTDGRVPLSCDTIRTADGLLSFQGVAVGDGQRLGLRALDGEVAAGTSFVVYVNASAALR
jgi:serine/threonine-protein kinase